MFITRWFSRNTNIGKVIILRKRRLFSIYPRFNACDEHTTHILTCPDTSIFEIRANLLAELSIWLSSIHMHHDIQKLISSGLSTCFNNPNTNYYDLTNDKQEPINVFKSKHALGTRGYYLDLFQNILRNANKSSYTSISSRKLAPKGVPISFSNHGIL